MRFQLRIKCGEGCMSYKYCDADTVEEAKKLSVEEMEKYADKMKVSQTLFPACLTPLKEKLPATVQVVEWDNEKKNTKRGGIKFKLRRSHFQVRFRGGGKHTEYSYEAD